MSEERKIGKRKVKIKDALSVERNKRKKLYRKEKPVSDAYGEFDNDLARDNMENDIPAADAQDL